MNIILIGYRGTGKSVVGALVGEKLGMQCVNMDSEIVSLAGRSIPEIVAESGWDRFREMESEVARTLSHRDNLVIDTGGGVIERPVNMEVLGKDSTTFWLKASAPVIVSRIEDDTQRPSLTEGKTFTEEVEEVLERRTPKYKSAADREINTDNLTPEQVADRIVKGMGERS